MALEGGTVGRNRRSRQGLRQSAESFMMMMMMMMIQRIILCCISLNFNRIHLQVFSSSIAYFLSYLLTYLLT
jgi:hypothetical protein